MKRSLFCSLLIAATTLLPSAVALAQSGARAEDVAPRPDSFRLRAEQAAAQGVAFIEEFQVRPGPDLKAGAQLAVSMRGTPGAKVELAIQGVRGVIGVPEVRYGEYATNYTIRGNDRISERSEVSVTMRFRDKVASRTLGQPLSLAAVAAAAPAAAARMCPGCAIVQDVKVVNLTNGSNGSGPGVSYRYEVILRQADGRLVTMPFDNDPGVTAGEQVRVVNGELERDTTAP